jgi:hypothetical protein
MADPTLRAMAFGCTEMEVAHALRQTSSPDRALDLEQIRAAILEARGAFPQFEATGKKKPLAFWLLLLTERGQIGFAREAG